MPVSKKHALLMLAFCLVPLIALGAVNILHIPLNQLLLYGMILICPISHLFMMKFMMHGEDHDHHHKQEAAYNAMFLKKNAEK